ncbi:hypothetical protein [Lysobacter sp. 1R34A]|uniref:hypothetical protein n=1 Tax=Lysobacter sp. 1R34A TaxID=3445786 RepID=UPI003EE97B38
MRKIVVFVIAMLASTAAAACECTRPPLDTVSARRAKHVFVFRLLSSELQTEGSSDPWTTRVIGKIRIVDTLRGTASTRTIRYSTQQCCGVRLDVGKYYAAFASSAAPQLSGDLGTLLELGDVYGPASGDRARIESVLAGKNSLEKAFSEYTLDRLHQVPRPPAPCPSGSKKSHSK